MFNLAYTTTFLYIFIFYLYLCIDWMWDRVGLEDIAQLHRK